MFTRSFYSIIVDSDIGETIAKSTNVNIGNLWKRSVVKPLKIMVYDQYSSHVFECNQHPKNSLKL